MTRYCSAIVFTGLMFNLAIWLIWFAAWLIAGFFVHPTRWSEAWRKRMQYSLLMALGFWLIFHDRRAAHSLLVGRLYDGGAAAPWIGNVMTIGGLLLAAWARFHLGRLWSGTITLKEGHRLIRTGPYRMARHPLYTGFLTAALGSAMTAATGDAFVGFALIVIAILIKMRREEALMCGEFGEEYRCFQRETRALLPFIY